MIVTVKNDPTGSLVSPIKPSLERAVFQTDNDFMTYQSEFESVKTKLLDHYNNTMKISDVVDCGSFRLGVPNRFLETEAVQIRYRKTGTVMASMIIDRSGIDVAAYAITAFKMQTFDRLAHMVELQIKHDKQALSTLKPLGKALTINDGEKLFNELKDLVFCWYYKRPRQITPENKHFSIETRFEETNEIDEDGDTVSVLMADVKFYQWKFSMRQYEEILPVESTERIIYEWERQL